MTVLDCAPLIKVPGPKGVLHIFVRTVSKGGDAWAHLLPGKDKALLVDTGFGVGDLKTLCETFTDLPIEVINTHSHGDHVGGNFQFDKAYIHELDVKALEKENAKLKGIARTCEPPGEVYFFEQDEVIQHRDYEIVPVKDGDVINHGGGYEYEIFHLPGHSPGEIAILDRKRRMLFSGDGALYTPTSMAGDPRIKGLNAPYEWYTIERYRDGLKRLCQHIGAFDAVYPGHSHLGLSPQVCLDLLACCEELLAGDVSAQEVINRGNYDHVPVHIHGMGKIYFSAKRIYASGS